jgi:hypothetical protein
MTVALLCAFMPFNCDPQDQEAQVVLGMLTLESMLAPLPEV